MRVVVVGLDGAGFELIGPWIDEGYLPNLARIRENGAWTDMMSVLPPVTSPNWKCYSTGKNPAKLGIFWWENIDWRNRRVYYPTGRKGENKEIWDFIGEEGNKVGILGMPTTYPPKKVNGFLIAGGETSDTGFAYPEELESELKQQGWRNHPTARFETDPTKRAREIHKMIDASFTTANNLANRYELDFLQVTIFYINNLHHFLWDSIETRQAWELVDRRIGEYMDSGCDLILMSDHGANKLHHIFNINAWLEQQGYLDMRPGISSVLYKLGITQPRLMKLLDRFGLLNLTLKLVPKRLAMEVPRSSGEVVQEAKTDKIDWGKSKAFASGQGPIYINPKHKNDSRLKEEIKSKLEHLINPDNGERIIERVYMKEELYTGKYLDEAPDLIVDQAKGVHIPGGIGQRLVFDSLHRWNAGNEKHGMFMAYGPNIKSLGRIQNISILDLAPTILHLMNVPIPRDMDGRVLREIFAEGSEPNCKNIEYYVVKEKDEIMKRIGRLKHSDRI